MENNIVKLTEQDLHDIINESVKSIVSEMYQGGGTIEDAKDLLRSIYAELDDLSRKDKTLAYDLATVINNVKTVFKILKNIR